MLGVGIGIGVNRFRAGNPELVSNYNFAAWTADNPDSFTVVGEVTTDPMVTEVANGARFYTTGGNLRLIQNVGLETGVEYTVIVNTYAFSATTGPEIYNASNSLNSIGRITSTGETAYDFVALSSYINISRNSACDCTFVSFSVKKKVNPEYEYEDMGELVSVIVGEEITIYGDEVAVTPITNTLALYYTCSIGAQVGNDYVITALSENIGSVYLYILALDAGVIVRQTRSILTVKEKVNTGSKTVTLIGDSLMTQGGDDELVEVRSIFDSMTWTGIGTQGTAPNLTESYTGKTYDWLVNHTDSPFTKAGVVDIPAYYTDNSLSVPDFIYIRMGVNDAFGIGAGDFDAATQATWIANISELMAAFLAHDANVEIIIGLPTISEDSGDGWEADYPGNTNQDNYITIIHQMWDAIIETYEGGIYNTRVSVAYAPWLLDRDAGYPKVADVHTNGVHPDASGYIQLGQGLGNALNNLL